MVESPPCASTLAHPRLHLTVHFIFSYRIYYFGTSNQLPHCPSSHQDQGIISPQRLCHRTWMEEEARWRMVWGERVCCYPLQHIWLLKEEKEFTENRLKNQVHKTKSSFPSIQTESTPFSQSFHTGSIKILLVLLGSKFCNTKSMSLMRWVHFCNVHFLWKCQLQNSWYVAGGLAISFHYNLYINMENDHLHGASTKKIRAILSH